MTRQSAMSIYRAYSLQSIRKQMGERWAIFFYSHHPYISIYLSLLAVALLNYAQANCIMMQQQRVERATLCHKCHHRCSPCNGNAMQSACKESRKKKKERHNDETNDEMLWMRNTYHLNITFNLFQADGKSSERTSNNNNKLIVNAHLPWLVRVQFQHFFCIIRFNQFVLEKAKFAVMTGFSLADWILWKAFFGVEPSIYWLANTSITGRKSQSNSLGKSKNKYRGIKPLSARFHSIAR